MTAKLTGKARNDALGTLKGWAEVAGRDAIHKKFQFADFTQAWGFMTRVALAAEKADHHPDELSIGWQKVRVTYVTHSAGGVTRKDLDAARSVSTFVRK